jgi:hypothetical protein
MVEILPYQDGNALPNEDKSATEILDSTETAKSGTNRASTHSQEVFMVRGPPPRPMPQPPDVQSDDEFLFNISPDVQAPPNETDE